MSALDSDAWSDLRERCERLQPGATLVTPVSERPFRIEATFGDYITVRFQDSGEERNLWREQFGVFMQRLDDGPVDINDLPPGVEPYASIVTLLGDYTVDDDDIVRAPDDAVSGTSQYLLSPAEAQTRPERLHDDALLLASVLTHFDATDPQSLDSGALTDLYVLLSDVQHESDRLRQTVREPLLARLGQDQELEGRFGTVRRTTRERRQPKDDQTVLDVLDEHGIPHEWVLGVDPDKLDVVLAVTDLTEEEVYDSHEQVYVQKTDVDEEEKYSRVRELADRIDRIDDLDGDDLRKELTDLESRLDEELSSSS